MKIHIHIERLVLDGLPIDRLSGPIVQQAVQAELSRLFADGGTSSSLQSMGAVPSLRTEPIGIRSGMQPSAIGQQIAHAIHGGMQS